MWLLDSHLTSRGTLAHWRGNKCSFEDPTANDKDESYWAVNKKFKSNWNTKHVKRNRRLMDGSRRDDLWTLFTPGFTVIKLTKAISFQFGVYLFVILGITRLWLFSHCILPFQSNAMQPWVHIRPFLFPFNHYRPLSRHNSNAIEPNRTQSNLSSPIKRNRTFDWVRLFKFFCESSIVFDYRT